MLSILEKKSKNALIKVHTFGINKIAIVYAEIKKFVRLEKNLITIYAS